MRTKYQKKAIQGFVAGIMVLCLAGMPAFTASAQQPADTDITSALNTELWVDNAIAANAIDVTTTDGIVTLEGTVTSILAKDRAQELAEATVGVRAIVNRIDVEPLTPRGDSELSKAVEDAWLADPVADSYQLSAKADDGSVTIRGTVQSYAEKDLAETVAKGVRGVKGIENEITVDYESTRPDLEIKNEVTARLENDVRVDDYLVDVEVNNGEVMLSGTVGSLQEKTQARSDAWVAGVTSVDTEGLDVKSWARDDMRRMRSYATRTEEEIKQAVEDAFLYDPRVMSYEPMVEVSNGTVTLSGTVDNLEAKRAAGQDARNTLGVWRVKNQLKVRPDIPANDELEERVSLALLDDPYIERHVITVDADNGWVYLQGDVNTSFEKNQAERVTAGVKGVVGIVNNLDFDYLWVWKPDWEIRQDVKDQLTWSPFVDGSNVSVSVDDGVVTLSGTVDSWSELEDAEKNAFQGGAKDVVNTLVVDYRYYGPTGPGYYGSPYYRGAGYHGPAYDPYW